MVVPSGCGRQVVERVGYGKGWDMDVVQSRAESHAVCLHAIAPAGVMRAGICTGVDVRTHVCYCVYALLLRL